MTQANAAGQRRRSGKATEPAGLRLAQVAWLAGSVFIVSAGYGALLPVLPGWLASMMPGANANEVGRHVGFLSGVYAAGVLVGAPLWGVVSDRVGRGRILMLGLVGYVASLLLLLIPAVASLWGLYTLRATTGFFVAAVVPVVAALVAEHTPEKQRARRFAWLGAMSLLGFLFGPALSAAASGVGPWLAEGARSSALSPAMPAQVALVLSALLGGLMMIGLAGTLPASLDARMGVQDTPASSVQGRPAALLWLSGMVMFVLAGFELGIVLQGQQSSGQSSRQAAIMLAECSLVMLLVNALLFVTSLLEKVAARILIGAGLLLAVIGLAVLAAQRADAWMYLGVSLTSAGTGLVLPVIAYLAAGASPQRLGAVMGGLAAASGFGQTLGSAAGGWLFGAQAHLSFGWLTLPLLLMLGLLVTRPRWWLAAAAASIARHPRPGERTDKRTDKRADSEASS